MIIAKSRTTRTVVCETLFPHIRHRHFDAQCQPWRIAAASSRSRWPCAGGKLQFEATEETLGTIWQHKAPELKRNYPPRDKGDQLVENFLGLVKDLSA